MTLLDLVRRAAPEAWLPDDGIPWSEPGFSRRMLAEHLSQAHDLASRRSETIDRHVDWICGELLSGRARRILDLGCGPGLYTSRLARRGHECVGVDSSPASIAHARELAEREGLRCTYLESDMREAAYGDGFDLAMMLSGELNVFRRGDARQLLRRAHGALERTALLLLEPQPFAAVRAIGERGPVWYTAPSGLWSDDPHLCLRESVWDPEVAVATTRYFITDARTGETVGRTASAQAYTDDEYRALLRECGFAEPEFHRSLSGSPEETGDEFTVIVARASGSD